jgi:hypothetical protein
LAVRAITRAIAAPVLWSAPAVDALLRHAQLFMGLNVCLVVQA